MALKKITRAEFDAMKPPQRPDGEETGWYALTEGHLIGLIIRRPSTDEWGAALYGLNEHKVFAPVRLFAPLGSEKHAEVIIKAAMEGLEASGFKIFPSSNYTIKL